MAPMHRFPEFLLAILLWQQTFAAADITNSHYWSDWSLWSACSADCEYGISTRTRECLSRDSLDSAFNELSQDKLQVNMTSCGGAYFQIKVCNLKVCPPDQTSPHQRSCSQYDTRTFSGRMYVWEPFIHPNDACKMACRAKGIHFYANLPDKATDGTPCKLGMSDAVCVKGVCKRVGCDGIVESAAVKDTCGMCGGNSSSCQTISGIFTSTVLKNGLNYVISIPAGSTNINITELQTSRNLLILQTVDGKSLINEDTSHPTSAIVQAAGTVFSYSAKSPSNQKETIVSAGPTNMTINLKLLMRGSNPGIMYTFSVPNEVSGTVIQQIRHHSQPIELPPEPKAGRHSQLQVLNSKDNALISQNNLTTSSSYTESSSSHPLFGDIHQRSFKNGNASSDKQLSTIDNSYQETLSSSVSEITPEPSGDVGNHYKEDSGDESESGIILSPPESFRPATDLYTVQESAATTQSMLRSHTLDSESNYAKIGNSTERSGADSNMETKSNRLNSAEENVDKSLLPPQPSKSMDDITNENIDAGYKNGDNVEEDNYTIFNEPSNNSSSAASDSIKNSPNDGNLMGMKNPVNGSVDEYKIVDLNRKSENGEYENKHNSQRSNIAADTLSGSKHSSRDIPEVGELGEETRNLTKKTSQLSKMDDISRISSKDSVMNKINYSKNMSVVDTPGASRDVGHPESSEKDESLKSPKTRPRYKIPRYSQSFTFAERYKDVNNGTQSNKGLQRPRTRQHTRRHQNHHQNGSHNIADHQNYPGSSQTTQNDTNTLDSQQSVFRQKPGKTTERLQNLDSSNGYIDNLRERNTNVDRGNIISGFGSFSRVDKSTLVGASDSHQSARDEETSRERRLRDRQILVEDRRRRVEEQRLRYNERLREYQERLRQRQTEIDETRRRSPHAAGTPRVIDSRTSDESSSYRRRYQYESNPPLSSRDEHDSHSSGIEVITPLPPPDITFTQSRSVMAGSDSNSNYWRQEQLQKRKGANLQTDPSPRTHSVLQPGKGEDDANVNNRVVSRPQGTYSSDHHSSLETFSGQTRSPYMPLIREPPRVEYPESYDGGNTNSYNSRNIPRVQQSGPRYIPGSSSGTAVTSALTGPEVPLGASSNKISSDTYISPTRQPRVFNKAGSDDPITLNTLETAHNTRSTIYEWRISGLTECTHTCGGGAQQTIVVCVDILTQAVVTDDNCRHIPKPKLLAVSCNTRPCSAEWTPSPWSSCSVSCGRGEQTRTVTCQARVSPTLNLTMPGSSCENQERIPNRQPCINNPCSSWRVGTWSNCSTPCGDGQKSRDVQCVDLENNVLPDNACLEFRPDSEERCNLGECGKGWFFTEWPAECPVECGTGEVTRQVFCADDTGSALPDSRCDTNQRPAVSQQCRVSRPCGGLWYTGQWSKCHAKCGSGNRRRDVLCIKQLPGTVHAVVDGVNCEVSDKPPETEPCEGQPCTSEWYMTSWSQCSQSCGTGYRTREVKCLDPDQKLQDDCSLDTRPRTRDACNTDECVNVEIEENASEDPICVDKFAQCKVVKRARLCRYGYYKSMCCRSCADDTLGT